MSAEGRALIEVFHDMLNPVRPPEHHERWETIGCPVCGKALGEWAAPAGAEYRRRCPRCRAFVTVIRRFPPAQF
jgi:hypothetical protein